MKEELEATPVYKLKVTLKDGDVKYIYLDAANWLELKETEKRKEDDTAIDVDTLFSNYKAVAGVVIAHSLETRVNGQLDDQTSIEKIEVNVPVDDSIFKMTGKTLEKPKTEEESKTKRRSHLRKVSSGSSETTARLARDKAARLRRRSRVRQPGL